MLVFNYKGTNYVFIHIPKNCGRYIRDEIQKQSNILEIFWDFYRINNTIFDLAHIPYILSKKYIKSNLNLKYFTFIRNPYDRLISAFYYLHPKLDKEKNIKEFQNFVLTQLPTFTFKKSFYCDNNNYIIHYYPQYMFLENSTNTIDTSIIIYKIESYNNEIIQLPKLENKTYTIEKYYTKQMIEIVNRIYDKDFNYFNYYKINRN